MGEIEEMEHVLSTLEIVETAPGKLLPSFGISNAMRQAGAVGLVLTVTGKKSDGSDVVTNAMIMRREGIFPSTVRFSAGKIAMTGSSSVADIKKGGGESVFSRLVTNKILATIEVSEYQLWGTPFLLFIIDLEAINPANAYGFKSDKYGSRQFNEVKDRISLLKVTKELEEAPFPNHKNEIMVRDHLPPSFIRRIVVREQELKDTLVKQLEDKKMILEKNEIRYIDLSPEMIKIDDFIVVVKTDNLNKELWL
jgi:hypothetical protein